MEKNKKGPKTRPKLRWFEILEVGLKISQLNPDHAYDWKRWHIQSGLADLAVEG